MEKTTIKKAVQELLKEKGKKKFNQSIDLIVNLRELDLKKPESQIEEFIVLPHGRAKPAKIGAFVGVELKDQAEKFCNEVVVSDNFDKLKEKREIQKLARRNHYFIAQANFMAEVAKRYGKYLGTVGRMPNPKAGQVVTPKGSLEPIIKKLEKTIKATNKKSPVIQCNIGSESFSEDNLVENILTVLNQLELKLPRGKQNLSTIYLKPTMGKPVEVKE